jgi:hypothetical protein
MSSRTIKTNSGVDSRRAPHIDGLSPRKHAAVLAVLSSPSVTAAAQTAGISRQSLHRWMKEPAFRKALTQARHLAVRQASAYVQGLAGEADATLVDVMQSKKASAASRVSASRVALELTYQLLEADEIAERRQAGPRRRAQCSS